MRHSRIRRYLRHGTLPQLAMFEASARLASFTRAGRELHCAQPTVSAQIRKLSECVGTALFAQEGRQIRLTEAGRRLHARCAELFGVFEALEGDLAALRDVGGSRLTVGACGASERFLARELARFGERHPDVEVALVIGNHAQLAERIATGADDLTLVTQPPPEVAVVRQWVAANPYVVMAAAGDPLADGRPRSFAHIAERPFVLREPGSATRALTERMFAAHGLRPRARFTLSTHHAVVEAVRAGDGLALLPRETFGADDGVDAPVALDVPGLVLPGEWHLVYRVGACVTPVAQAFLDHMRQASARMASPVRAYSGGREAGRPAAALA